ncbi:MAG: hypothetical protein N4A65_03205 [Cohaesibacter sp.]|jgi:hypothetical protein|nr:hypothetical protein [Cohaesibacter sp.]
MTKWGPLAAVFLAVGFGLSQQGSALASSDDALKKSAMTFTLQGNGGNCLGCEWIAAEGRITKDSHKSFEALDTSMQVVLSSSGGDRAGAIALGEAFRQKGVSIVIGKGRPFEDTSFHEIEAGLCEGACLWTFLGGANRQAQEGEIIVPDLSGPNGLDAELIDYVQTMGGNLDILRRAANPDRQERIISHAESLDAYGLRYNAFELQPWQLMPQEGGLAAISRSKDGMRHLSYRCTGKGQRELVLFESKRKNSPYPIPLHEDLLTDIHSLSFLGQELTLATSRVQEDDYDLKIHVPVPAAFRSQGQSDALRLTNQHEAARYQAFNWALSPYDLEETFALVDRICGL